MSFTLKIEHLCFRPSNREEVTNIIKALEDIPPRALLDLLGMSEIDKKWEETLKKKANYFPFKYETPPAHTHEGELNQIKNRDKEWEEQVLKLRVFHYLQAYVSEAIVALKAEKRRENVLAPTGD